MPKSHRAPPLSPSSSYRLVMLDGAARLEWIGPPSSGDVDRAIDLLVEESTRRGRFRCLLVVVTSSASMPDHEGRLAFIRNVDRSMLLCERMVILLMASPFVNAFARGLVTTANVMPRFRGRVAVTDDVDRCRTSLVAEHGCTPAQVDRLFA